MVGIAPGPMFPERADQAYQRAYGQNIPGNKGPLRFEEGIATDTDVPNDFSRGAYFDTSSGSRPGQNNPEMLYKHAGETMQERAHVGSAAWIEAPSVLNEFVQGSRSGYGAQSYERVFNSGQRIQRQQPTVVQD
jgi:hypothetical protein